MVDGSRERLDSCLSSYAALSRLAWKMKHASASHLLKHVHVFIKPNIGATSKFANTDPEIVRGIIHYLKDCGIKDIVIGEGSGETEYESTPYNFHYASWDKLAKEEGVELLDLNNVERTEVPWHYGKIGLPKVLNGRSYINVAKLKTHMQTTVSLCTKNQKGLLNSQTRRRFHMLGLHEPIVHLADVVKPEVCLVDGITAIEGNGPGDLGHRRKMGLVIVGDDMLEVDRTCCSIMGIDPKEIQHIRAGPMPIPALSSVANPPFRLPDAEFKMGRVHMRADPSACTACMSSIGKMNKLLAQTRIPRGLWFFIKNGLVSRLDIVIGNPSNLPSNHGNVIFYGNCARKIAEQHPEYPFIKGCPPVSKDALDQLIGAN